MRINYKNIKTLAVITARGGSKRLAGKNLLELAGKPLIGWTIESALSSKYINKVIVSSDDSKILSISRIMGAETPFVRPKKLSTDRAKSIDVIMHAINKIPGFDYVILLQPTSPLRKVEHINGAFKKLFELNAESCVSVCKANEISHLSYLLDRNGYITPVQKKNKENSLSNKNKSITNLNGAIYISKISWLKKYNNFTAKGCAGYQMPYSVSDDIDTNEDFERVKLKFLRN